VLSKWQGKKNRSQTPECKNEEESSTRHGETWERVGPILVHVPLYLKRMYSVVVGYRVL